MTFTELEYVLMLACVVLLWRSAVMNIRAKDEEHRANKYARWLMGVYNNKGKIVHKDDGYYFEETNQ